MPYRSGETSLNSFRLAGFTCARRDAVKTNCPTQLEKLQGGHEQKQDTTTWKYTPSQERVEGEVGDEDTVEELDDAGKHKEDQERVDRLEPR